MKNAKFMKIAIDLARQNIDLGGGPFGAVIVRDGEIIAKGVNKVTNNNDPTAHAEVTAIREAAKVKGDYDLSDCEIYSSCEPCPMCLGAIYWARLKKLYFAANKDDAANAGFDDSFIYDELDKDIKERSLPTEKMDREKALEVFKKWIEFEDKTEY